MAVLDDIGLRVLWERTKRFVIGRVSTAGEDYIGVHASAGVVTFEVVRNGGGGSDGITIDNGYLVIPSTTISNGYVVMNGTITDDRLNL